MVTEVIVYGQITKIQIKLETVKWPEISGSEISGT